MKKKIAEVTRVENCDVQTALGCYFCVIGRLFFGMTCVIACVLMCEIGNRKCQNCVCSSFSVLRMVFGRILQNNSETENIHIQYLPKFSTNLMHLNGIKSWTTWFPWWKGLLNSGLCSPSILIIILSHYPFSKVLLPGLIFWAIDD